MKILADKMSSVFRIKSYLSITDSWLEKGFKWLPCQAAATVCRYCYCCGSPCEDVTICNPAEHSALESSGMQEKRVFMCPLICYYVFWTAESVWCTWNLSPALQWVEGWSFIVSHALPVTRVTTSKVGDLKPSTLALWRKKRCKEIPLTNWNVTII
jgi:hypothetical protein